MSRRTFLLLITFVASVAACDSGSAEEGRSAASNGQRIDGAEARRLVSDEGAFLLDVRTPAEFASGHVEGATNIPVQDLPARLADVPADRPVVVYCQAGGRSASATEMLVEAGRTVHDLGSLSAW